MRIAVIGTGHVGAALGAGWAAAGHQVIFGVRDPGATDVREVLKSSQNLSAVAVSEAASKADVVALAIPFAAVEEVLRNSAAQIKGKILIDCTNPTTQWPAIDHSAGSGGERVSEWAHGARVVKAFNTTGFENMRNPRFGESNATMFYAGDDSAAKIIVGQLAADLGFDPGGCRAFIAS